jgi:hypothetical protein
MNWLLDEVHASLDRERGPVAALRALSTPARTVLVGLAVAAMVLGVFLVARRADFVAYSPLRIALVAASYVALLGLLVSRALRPLYRTAEPAGREMALVAACFFAPFVWAAIPSPALSHFVDISGGGKDCLLLGLAFGAAVIGLVRLLDRAAESNFRAAAMLSAAGGLTANLALVFHCPQTRALHLLLVHAPIGLLLLFVYRRLQARMVPRRAG